MGLTMLLWMTSDPATQVGIYVVVYIDNSSGFLSDGQTQLGLLWLGLPTMASHLYLCSAKVDHLRLCDLTLHICWNVGYCVLMSCHLLCLCLKASQPEIGVVAGFIVYCFCANLSLQRYHSVYLVASPDWCWPMSPATADSVTLIQNACYRMHRDACSRKCLGSKLTKTQLLEGLLKSAKT